MTTHTKTPSMQYTGDYLQHLVDDAAASGVGVVHLPEGVFTLRNTLKLRSSLRIVGAGAGKTVLTKSPSVTSKIPAYLGYGHYEIIVQDPDLFDIGDSVHAFDSHAPGFYSTVATLIEKRPGGVLILDRPINHDYLPEWGATAVRVHSMLEGVNISDVTVENLTLDGAAQDQTYSITGCRGAGVFLIGVSRLSMRNVEVHNFSGDAVSFQQCVDILVEDCDIHHNKGGGLHPGSGSVRYVMRRNHIHHNASNGLFYCLRTSHSICQGNRIHHNAHAGISIGERDTDHLIIGNEVTDNVGHGVEFREIIYLGGDRVVFQSNNVARNGSAGSAAQIIIRSRTRDVDILENRIEPTAGQAAVLLEPGCQHIGIVGNTVAGRPLSEQDITGDRTTANLKQRQYTAPIGPDALPLTGAAHLNIPLLGACNLPRV